MTNSPSSGSPASGDLNSCLHSSHLTST
eukprot:SM000219S06682  [mRNA]  locus=s219:66189:66269:- [translate_table: standard]